MSQHTGSHKNLLGEKYLNESHWPIRRIRLECKLQVHKLQTTHVFMDSLKGFKKEFSIPRKAVHRNTGTHQNTGTHLYLPERTINEGVCGVVCGMGGTVEEDRGKREEKREGRGMRMEEHKFQYHSSVKSLKGYETR